MFVPMARHARPGPSTPSQHLVLSLLFLPAALTAVVFVVGWGAHFLRGL